MGLKGCPGHQGPWQTLAASSDPTSVNHKFGAAFDRNLALERVRDG